MVKCPNCGNEVTHGNFCGKCGTKISGEEVITSVSNTKKCSSCGAEVDSNSEFCSKCGFSFNGSSASGSAKSTKFCSNCGEKIDINAVVCPKCGVAIVSQKSHKSPGLAAVLSFFIVGLGQVYNGQLKKGIILFIGAVISGILFMIVIGIITWFIIWVYSMYDAYKSAQEINQGMVLEDKIDFDNLLHK